MSDYSLNLTADVQTSNGFFQPGSRNWMIKQPDGTWAPVTGSNPNPDIAPLPFNLSNQDTLQFCITFVDSTNQPMNLSNVKIIGIFARKRSRPPAPEPPRLTASPFGQGTYTWAKTIFGVDETPDTGPNNSFVLKLTSPTVVLHNFRGTLPLELTLGVRADNNVIQPNYNIHLQYAYDPELDVMVDSK